VSQASPFFFQVLTVSIVTTAEYTAESRDAFKTACQLSDEELKDSTAVFEALPWLKEWRHTLMINATNNWRDNGTLKRRLMQELQTVISYVRPISLLAVDVN
jgi:hypothetical protein